MKIWLFVLFVVGVVHCKTRNYYIAAEEIQWNYAPSGMDNFAQLPLEESEDASTFFEQNNERIGGTYIKALYIGYTDDTFTERIERKREEQHLGFLGPVIYGEVGDTLKIHFLNRCTRPYSIHAQGIKTNRDDEGASVPGNPNPNSGGNSVEPGEEHVYTWNIPTRSGPSIGDWSSSVWIYTSHVDVVKDSNSGLLGAVVITRHGMADNDGKPKDVDKELFTLYSVFDENQSHYLEDNIRTFIGPNVSLDDVDSDGFQESNLMHGINGYLYINGGPNEVTQGERARWYLLSLGTEVDIHTAHWHGQTLINSFGHRVDVSVILPATVDVLDMYGDNPGIWFMHCHVNDHVDAGMMDLFTVHPKERSPSDIQNYATTYDYFYFLNEATNVGDGINFFSQYLTSSVSDPFSEASYIKPFHVYQHFIIVIFVLFINIFLFN